MNFPIGKRVKIKRGASTLKRRPIPRKRARNAKLTRKTTSKGIPMWLKCVPEGQHGSGSLQKRLWRLTSDYVRIRDTYAFEGRCIATGTTIYDWNMGQAGHYRAYPSCNGMFKFDPMNIHLQTAQSNSWPDSRTWEVFAQNLVNRYGPDYINAIDHCNAQTPLKITTDAVLAAIEKRIADISTLKEKPKYWDRLMKLRQPNP